MKRSLIMILLCFFMIPNIKAMETSARSAILMDIDSGRILYSKNIHHIQSVASISKIMTAVLAIESGKMEEEVTVGNEIDKAYGSAIYIKKGEKLKLKDLVYGLMLRSGNDAALTIATKVSGSLDKFVEKMNQKALEIGMKNTTFQNPHGLDESPYTGNMSTAYDMAVLSSYASKNKEYLNIVGTKEYKLKTNLNTYSWHNKNKMLNQYKYTTGGKTGYTKKAKRTLVSTAKKNNLHLTVVTLNDGNDFKDHKDLYEEAFNIYQKYDLLQKGNLQIYEEKLYKDYEFYLKNSFSYPMTKEERENVYLEINIKKQNKIKDNSSIGNIKVKIDDKELIKENIYIQKKKQKKKNLWSKVKELFS